MGSVVTGGTGLVGAALLDQLSARGEPVVAIARRSGEPRIGVLWYHTDLARLRPDEIPADTTAAYCTLGTTIKNVGGSQEEFRRVDHDLVVAFAKACRAAGVPTFLLVSAAGADAGARVFYNRVKGETEAAVRALGFPSLCLLRPGLLLGDRKQRRRLERVLVRTTRALRPVMPGILKGNEVREVAAAMQACAADARPGVRVVGHAEIRALAGRSG